MEPSKNAASGVSAALCGFVPVLSIGRSLLNQRAGGGRVGGLIAAALCLATLFGAGAVISYIPTAALGGLVLFLGLGMLKQWLWDPWRTASRVELAQITVLCAAFLVLWPLRKWSRQVQIIGSAFVALAGIAWVVERLFFS